MKTTNITQYNIVDFVLGGSTKKDKKLKVERVRENEKPKLKIKNTLKPDLEHSKVNSKEPTKEFSKELSKEHTTVDIVLVQEENRVLEGELKEEPQPFAWGMNHDGNLTRSTMKLIRQALNKRYLIPEAELEAAPEILLEMLLNKKKKLSDRHKIMAAKTLMEMRKHNFDIAQVAMKLVGVDSEEDVRLIRSPLKVD